MPRVAIILRSFNESKLIGKCLEAVFAQEFSDYEVLLVDSGSTDGTLDIARRFRVRTVPIARQEFTYGRALNVGVRAAEAGTDVAVFLSAHAIPTNTMWLCHLTEPVLKNDNVAGCYGRQTPLEQHLSNRIVRHMAKNGYRQCYGDEAFVTNSSHFFSNANAAVRYRCWEEIPYDEHMPYSEDWKWARETIARGWSLAYAPDACVAHSHPDSIRQFLRRRRNEERGYIAMEGDGARGISLGGYVRSIVALVRRFVEFSLGRRMSVQEAVDFLLVESLMRTAAYLERRPVARARKCQGAFFSC
jgi:rhamnosyltransferase